MSGHSKWATIHRQKAVNDAKRGKIFTKVSKDIIVAVQEAGSDPDTNFRLRLAIDKARAVNMPADNIERAIKRGNGEFKGEQIQTATYEAYGPGGVAVLIDCQTDNLNRSVTEVRSMVEKSGGKFLSGGGVAWLFIERGVILLSAHKLQKADKFGKQPQFTKVTVDDMQLDLFEIGGVEDLISDIADGVEAVEVITQRDNFRQVLKEIEDRGYKVEQAELAKLATEKIAVNSETEVELSSFLEAVEDCDDVVNVWHNASY